MSKRFLKQFVTENAYAKLSDKVNEYAKDNNLSIVSFSENIAPLNTYTDGRNNKVVCKLTVLFEEKTDVLGRKD